MRSTLLVVLAAVLALSGCTTVIRGESAYAGPGDPTTVIDPSTPPAEHEVRQIAWHDCTSIITSAIGGQATRDLEYKCGVLQVPLDYYDPATTTMPVALLRTHLPGTSGQQPLLVNPGGPGAAGTDLAVGLALQLDESVLQSYDIIGFDPRGTGQSQPIRCLDDAAQDEWVLGDPAPQTDEARQQLLADYEWYAEQCTAAYPGIQYLNTMATARDMDQIRSALGSDKLNYLGYSYGTQLGAVYLTLFPDRAGAFVLDGAVDLKLDRVADFETQVAGFEDAFDRFAADCIARSCPAAPDPRAMAMDLIASTRQAPLTNPDDERAGGPAVVLTALASAMYDDASWPDLGVALSEATNGDPTGLFELADAYWGRYTAMDGEVYWSNLLDANAAINCADTSEDITFEEATTYAEKWSDSYPLFGTDSAYALSFCSLWPTARYPIPDVDASAVATPVVVIGTTHDPATPYSGAISLTEDLGGPAVLLTFDGDGHTAYPGASCIDAAVNGYLLSGAPPAAGTTCQP